MRKIPFEDKNQNFWELASIQSAALGFPVILVGGAIASEFGPGVAIGSIFMGNLILWLIALATIGMTSEGANAIENVGEYFGKIGKLAFGLIIGAAFLGWYTLQSKASAAVLGDFFGGEVKQQIRIGSIFGVLVALTSMGGIRFIKRFNVISLPVVFLILMLFTFTHHIDFKTFKTPIGFSFSGMLSTVFIILPGILNLPTFFRHSKSKAHSFLALAIMTIIVSIFQCLSILIGASNQQDIINLKFNPFLIITFTVISLFSINLVNIYLASGVLETFFRRAADPRDYAVLGLAGTGAFALLQALPVMNFVENTINGFIASLGVILIMAFLMKIIVRHRPRLFEKIISNGCWLIGAFASLGALIRDPGQPNVALLVGVGASLLSFLIVIFIEESIWAFNNSSIRIKKQKLK